MSETGFSDKTPPDLLRFSYVPANAFSQMPPLWRALKLEELGVVESLWDTKQPEACLPKAEKWAASYRDTLDLTLAPVPLELADSLHKRLVRGYSSPDGEALMRLSAILRGILEGFEPGVLLQALDRDLRLCKACGPIAIFVNSELEVISANALAWRHFGGARPALGQLLPALQHAIINCVQERNYTTFRCGDKDGGKWDATIVPWQGLLQGATLSLERPRQLRRDDLEPAIQFLQSCTESLRSIFQRWQSDREPARIGPQLEELHRRLRSDYYVETISGLARSAGPEFSTDLNYHAAHVPLRGLGDAFLPYVHAISLNAKEPEFLSGVREQAAATFSWALRLVHLIQELLESFACEGDLVRSSFPAVTAVTAAFDRLRTLDFTGAVDFQLDTASSAAEEHQLLGDRRLIERACFGILYEMLYHRNHGSVTVDCSPDTVEGSAGVRIEFQDHPERHDALHTAGFTGVVVAEKIVRAHGGQVVISASRRDEDPHPRRISIWIPNSP